MTDGCTGGICGKSEEEKILWKFCKHKEKIKIEDQVANWRMLG